MIEKRAALLRRNVRRFARQQGLTLREVAELSGISERSLYNILRPPRAREEPSYPSFESLVLLAWALGTTEAQLLGREGPQLPLRGLDGESGEQNESMYVPIDEAGRLLSLGPEELAEFLHPLVEEGAVRATSHPMHAQLFHRCDLERVGEILGGQSA